MSKARQRGKELLADIETTATDIIRSALVEAESQGLPMVDQAPRIARNLSDHLADAWGGQQLYVPMDISRRNARIFAEFTGDNHADLAAKYHMGIHNIYSIISAERARRNPHLPFWDEG